MHNDDNYDQNLIYMYINNYSITMAYTLASTVAYTVTDIAYI